MCGQPPVSVFTNPDAVSLEAGQIQSHFERLLLTATIISTMGNTHILSGMVNHRARVGHQETTSFSPSSSNSRFSSNNETNRPSTNNQNVIRRLCSLSMAILGGPLPPSPGLVPMCWDELVDWTEEATLMTEMIQQRKRGDLNNLFSQPKKEADALSSQSLTSSSWHQVELKFIPFVSSCESEESLDRLSSLTYMEKVQFYQESVGTYPFYFKLFVYVGRNPCSLPPINATAILIHECFLAVRFR